MGKERTKDGKGGLPYHHGDLRAALIEAALGLIEQHGVKAFSLKDAAKAAGVSVAAPYRHFADKDALIGAIQTDGFSRFDAELRAAYGAARNAETRLEELGVAYLGFAKQNPSYFQVMFGSFAEPANEGEHSHAEGFQLLVRAVGEAFPEEPKDRQMDRVLLAWSAVHGLAMLQMEGSLGAVMGEEDAEVRLRRVLRLMIHGLGDGVPRL